MLLAMIHNILAKTKRKPQEFNPMVKKPKSSISAREFIELVKEESQHG